MNSYFYCIETGEYITREQLVKEFSELKKADPVQYDYSFSHYIMNCLTSNNGSLQTMQQRKNNLEKQYFFCCIDEQETELDSTEEKESILQELKKVENYMQQ